jgi:hypothetical protein
MSGSPGGLMRIDRIFGGTGYTNTFGNAPLVFGAFPSLHAGTSTMEALFLTYFFPKYAPFYWAYAGTLYWATMYLTHHYLVDVVGGGCLALGCFYYFMPKEFKDLDTGIMWDAAEPTTTARAEDYELVDEDEAFDQAMDLAGAKVPYHNASEPRRAEEGQSARPTIAPRTSEVNVSSARKEPQNRLRSVSSSNVNPGEGSARGQ